MLRKVGPAALKDHFMLMDTICDATQERQDAVSELVSRQEQVRGRRPCGCPGLTVFQQIAIDASSETRSCQLAQARGCHTALAPPSAAHAVTKPSAAVILVGLQRPANICQRGTRPRHRSH